MKKVLLTGASGFIGKNILLQKPDLWHVTAVSNACELNSFVDLNGIKNVVCNRVDLSSNRDIERISGSYDLVIWLAANGDPALSVLEPTSDLIKNTYALVNTMGHIDINVFVYFSSGAVYDGIKGNITPESKLNPKLPYAISKLAAEQYVKHFSKKGRIKNYQIVRFFGAYGPYEPSRKIYSKLVIAFGVNKDKIFKIKGDGRNYIDAMYIDDTVEGIKLIVENVDSNQVFDFFFGNRMPLNRLVTEASEIFGLSNVEIIHEGVVPEYMEFVPVSDYMRKNIGWKPKYYLKDGLLKFYDHLVNAPKITIT